MGFWVYLALCANKSIYTGATTDLIRRWKEHNRGSYKGNGAKYTAAHRPVSLVQAWEVETWSNALRLEYWIKRCGREEKELLIQQPEQICQIAERRKLDFSIMAVQREIFTSTCKPD